jgi:hypothetical protein
VSDPEISTESPVPGASSDHDLARGRAIEPETGSEPEPDEIFLPPLPGRRAGSPAGVD